MSIVDLRKRAAELIPMIEASSATWRNKDIAVRCLNGQSTTYIGEWYGLCRQRAWQLAILTCRKAENEFHNGRPKPRPRKPVEITYTWSVE